MIKFFHIQLFYLLFIGSTIYAQTPQFSTNQTVAITATYPLNSTSSNKGQWLYAPGDFGSAPSGYITTIYIKPATTISSAVYTNFTIKIGHTNKTTLTTTWITGLQTCYFAASQTFNSVTTDAWLPITLQTPFTLDADKYLVIEISQITFTTGFSLRHNIVTFNGRSWGPINSVTSSGNSDNQLITGIDVIPSKHKDAGILSIDKPVNPITPGTDTIKATLLNFGTDTLKTVKLRWSVNGSPQSNPSDWTGSLLQYDSARNITFGPYNFTTGIYDITTWTYKPDNVDDSTAFNDTASFTLYSCNPASGTYIIDSSGTSDFSTFNAALEWIKNCGISGPVTFRIKPGTYTEQLNIPPIPGASSTNTITFESYDLDSTSVILTYASNHSQYNYVVKLNGADYIIFRKMTIRATGKTYGRVVEITNNAYYNILANNILQTLVTTSTNHAVIYSYYVLDQYNTIINNVISGGYYGIFMYGVSTSSMESGNIIEGNDINNFYYYGILIGYQNGISIRKNSLVNSSDSGSVYAIYSHYCYNNIVISRNNFKLTSVANIYALYMNYNTGTTSLYGNVSNNFISLGGTSTGTFYGIYMVTPAYQNISFNTVNIYGTNST